jgi:apolipoprotein N-acyltransferase
MDSTTAHASGQRSQAALELSRRGRLLLAVVSAVGMVLACPDYDMWWLAFVMWVPLLAAIDGARPKAALGYGTLTGAITVFWGFSWLSGLLTKFAGFSLPVAIPIAGLFSVYHGLIWGLSALVIAWLARRAPTVPVWITAPLVWIGVEATLPNIFPIYMAQAWAWQPVLTQTAEIGGVTMVSGIMVAINAGLFVLGKRWLLMRRLDRPAAAVTFALVVGVPAYGAMRIAQVEAEIEAAPKLRVGVVQGNMSIRQMATRRWKPRILAAQQRMSRELQDQGAELIVWGETAYPNGRVFYRQSVRDLPEGDPWRVRTGFTVPVIFGAVTRDHTGMEPYPYNTAILIGEGDRVLGMYDKVYRLVFGEYVPIVDPEWYLERIPSASHLEKGDGPGVIEMNGVRLGPFICYEDILPRFVRETANQGVHMFVNLTNDAWFGKTHEPAQHLGLAALRTVEHRKGLVRAVNTGISTYIDPTGRAHVKTRVTDPDIEGPQEPDGFVVDVPLMDPEHRTLYGMSGELFNALAVLGVALIALGGPRWGARGAEAIREAPGHPPDRTARDDSPAAAKQPEATVPAERSRDTPER